MRLKPCPFCGAEVDMKTRIGNPMGAGLCASASVSCPVCKDVSQGVCYWHDPNNYHEGSKKHIDLRTLIPYVDAPMHAKDHSGMHPTVRAALRPVVIKQAAALWDRRHHE